MATKDKYYTIASPSEGLYKEKGSKFIAFTFPVQTVEEVKICLSLLQKIHFKARHHCYAYRLGIDQNNFRTNDDGEPSGTAGKPILGQIDKNELTDILIVVVRYFGGTKLGASGLIKAYRLGAEEVILHSNIIQKTLMQRIWISYDYSVMGDLLNCLKRLSYTIIKREFEPEPRLLIEAPLSEKDDCIAKINAILENRPFEDIPPDFISQKIKWTFVD